MNAANVKETAKLNVPEVIASLAHATIATAVITNTWTVYLSVLIAMVQDIVNSASTDTKTVTTATTVNAVIVMGRVHADTATKNKRFLIREENPI